jgi:hypothetical protein
MTGPTKIGVKFIHESCLILNLNLELPGKNGIKMTATAAYGLLMSMVGKDNGSFMPLYVEGFLEIYGRRTSGYDRRTRGYTPINKDHKK